MSANGEIKIEKNIPLPETPRSWASKYPWDNMQVGDSFFIEKTDGEQIHVTRERANKATQYAKRTRGHRYCTRMMDGGFRVWRIE